MSLQILLRRRAFACAAALAVSAALPAPPAHARPVTVEDLLQREGIGDVAFDPSGRRVFVERQGPYASGARFDLESFNDIARTTLWTAPVDGATPLAPLVSPEAGAGYKLGPISPDGARVAVYRLKDDAWRLGVANLADGAVEWFDIAPEWPFFGRSLQWRSATELLVFTTPDGDLPRPFRFRNDAPRKLPARWAASRDGAGAHIVFGSGRYHDSRAKAPPRKLLRLDLARGAQSVLAEGAFTDLEISPDGRWAALLDAAEDIRLSADKPLQGEYGVAAQRQRLRLIDLERGKASAPAPQLDLLSFLSWSPSGRELLIYARRDGEAWPAGELLRLTAATGRTAAAAAGVQPHLDHLPELVRAGWLEGDPLVYGRRRQGRAATSFSAAASEAAWYRITAKGPVLAAGVSVRANRSIPTRFDRIPQREPTPGGPNAPGRRLAMSPDGARELRLIPSDTGGDARVTLFGAGAPKDVLHLNVAQADIDPPVFRAIAHVGPSGEPLTSWLLMPTRRRAPGPAPLIVTPYLGAIYQAPPASADWRNGSAKSESGLLAAAGYAVLFPSLPVSPRAEAPADRIAERMLALVDAIGQDPDLARQVDVTRVGLWGTSYGGYSVLSAVTQSDRFRAVVAMAAPTQMFSKHGEFHPQWRVDPSQGIDGNMSMGYVEANQGSVGAPPWRAPERYIRFSPALHADRINTPVLLLHGDQDNILHTQAEAMFMGLYRQDKDAQLVTYWGEGHAIRSPGNIRDLFARGIAFLDERVAGWGPDLSPIQQSLTRAAGRDRAPAPASGEPRARSPQR